MAETTFDEIIVQARVFAYAKAKSSDIKDLSEGDEYLKRLAFGENLYKSRAPFWCNYDSWTIDEAATLLSGMLPITDNREFSYGQLYCTDHWMSVNTPTRPILIFSMFSNNFACFKYVKEILSRSSVGKRAHPTEWAEYARAKGLLPHTCMIDIDNSPLLSLLNPSDSEASEAQSCKEVAIQSKSGPTYSTPWIDIQNEAITEFFNPRRNPDAKREEVVEWIIAKVAGSGLKESRKIAEAIFTIIKPYDHDPKKKRS